MIFLNVDNSTGYQRMEDILLETLFRHQSREQFVAIACATAITLYPHNSVRCLHTNIFLNMISINAISAYTDN